MSDDGRCIGRGDDLRGCIGTIEPTDSVYDTVATRAASAALEDSRFPHTVSVEELPFITLEISVLTPPVPVKSAEEIVIGKHGIRTRLGSRNHPAPLGAQGRAWRRRLEEGRIPRVRGYRIRRRRAPVAGTRAILQAWLETRTDGIAAAFCSR